MAVEVVGLIIKEKIMYYCGLYCGEKNCDGCKYIPPVEKEGRYNKYIMSCQRKKISVFQDEIIKIKKRIAEINSFDLIEIYTDIKITDDFDELRFTGLDNFSILKMYLKDVY